MAGEIAVSVLGSKHLSQSSLITRSLRSSFQVGSVTHRSTAVESDDLKFRIPADPEEPLILTLRNGQTQTVMYIRNVPFVAVLGRIGPTATFWLGVFPPGDPRNASFDESVPPRPDAPQIHLQLRRVFAESSTVPTLAPVGLHSPVHSPGPMSRAPDNFLTRERERLEEELARTRQQELALAAGSAAACGVGVADDPLAWGRGASPERERPSMLGRPSLTTAFAIQEKERQAREIKDHVASINSAQRKVQTKEQQLETAQRAVDEIRARVERAEQDLRSHGSMRASLEREKQEAREACAQGRDTLRLRDLSIVELRAAREDAEAQLDRAREELRRHHGDLETSTRGFDGGMQDMLSELDSWQSEAQGLTEQLARCDSRASQIQSESDGHIQDSGRAAEIQALRHQMDSASAELEGVRQKAREQAARVGDAEAQSHAAAARLAKVEAAAEAAKASLQDREVSLEDERRRSEGLREEASSQEKELIAYMSRAAQLEGQVGENKNQLREMEKEVQECLARVQLHAGERDALENTISELRREAATHDAELEMTRVGGNAAESRLAKLREENEEKQRAVADTQRRRLELEITHTRQVDDLDSTTRVVDGDLGQATRDAQRLREAKEQRTREAAGTEAEAMARAAELEQIRSRAATLEREVEVVASERAQRDTERQQAARKLSELEVESQEAQRHAAAADAEVAAARASADSALASRSAREDALEEKLRALSADLAAVQSEVKQTDSRRASTADSLDDMRHLLPEKRLRVEGLSSEEQRLCGEKARLQSRTEEARRTGLLQAQAIKKLDDAIRDKELQLGTAAADASSSEDSQLRLRHNLEAERASRESRLLSARDDLAQTHAARTSTAEKLAAVRTRRVELAERRAALATACGEAAARLRAVQREDEASSGVTDGKLRSAEEDLAQLEAEEARLSIGAAGLDAQLARVEERCARDLEIHSKLVGDVEAQRQRLAEEKKALGDCDADLAACRVRQTGVNEDLASAREQASVLQRRAAELRAQLVEIEAATGRAEQLRNIVSSVHSMTSEERDRRMNAAAQKDAELDSTRRAVTTTSTELLDQKNAELDGRILRIDELEREVLQLEGMAEGDGNGKCNLARLVGEAEAEASAARERVTAQLARLTPLQKDLQALEEMKWQLEGRVTAAQARAEASETVARRCEREAAEQAQQLVVEQARAGAARSQKRSQVQAVRDEVLGVERQNFEASQDLARCAREVEAVREEREASRRRLHEREARNDILSTAASQLQMDQQAAEAERSVAAEQANRQLSDLQEIEEEAVALDSGIDALAAQEHKVRLIGDQLRSREEALRKAKEEARLSEVGKEDFMVELEQCREQLSGLGDKLAYQVEHGNLQFSTIQKLEEGIHTHESEAEIFTLGLHEAEQMCESLRRENFLMRQQVEGLYEGTLQDWASEVRRIKVSAEVERHKDELAHWRQVAQEAERHQHRDLSHEQREDEEVILRQKLDLASEELARVQEAAQAAGVQASEATQGEELKGVHSVPAALHGLSAASRPPPPNARRRRALVIGCNYSNSHAPLQGCGNDAWNVQCLLRHSLQYAEDQVRCLIDGSATSSSAPTNRRPTKANILDGFKWLTTGAVPGDNLFLFFCGYGTQQPQISSSSVLHYAHAHNEPLFEAHLVPEDFGEDLPHGFFSQMNSGASPEPFASPAMRGRSPSPVRRRGASPGPGIRRGQRSSYRLVPLAELTNSLVRLPGGCKVTVVLDCGHSVVPGVAGINPAPTAFPQSAGQVDKEVLMEPRSKYSAQPREIDLPLLPTVATPIAPGMLECNCHCYSACQSTQWCAELSIEGAVQGAFTWSFVKALTLGHLCTTVQQHSRAMTTILQDMRQFAHWNQQTPLVQLSAVARDQDVVLISA